MSAHSNYNLPTVKVSRPLRRTANKVIRAAARKADMKPVVTFGLGLVYGFDIYLITDFEREFGVWE